MKVFTQPIKYFKRRQKSALILSILTAQKPAIEALLMVMIVGGAVLLMALSASVFGMNEMEMGYNSQNGQNAFSIADSCDEEALLRLKRNSSYTGGTLSLGGGSCIISITGTLPTKVITVTGTLGNYDNEIQTTVNISSSNVTVTNWTELTN